MTKMNLLIRTLLFFVFASFAISCSNSLEEVNEMFDKSQLDTEEAKNVELLYSDSSIVKVKVNGETLIRHISRKNPYDEFPDGLEVEFYDDKGRVTSWMNARNAIRYDKTRLVIANFVELYNRQNEKLETSELIWDEDAQKLYTDKFVQISQPTKQDTIWGYGFETEGDFNQFKIKNKFAARTNIEGLIKAINAAKPDN